MTSSSDLNPEKDPLFEPVLDKERVFTGGYLAVDKLSIKLPDGRTGHREVVQVRNSVAVLPVDGEGNAHLVRQHRPAIGKTIEEVPAGVLDRGEQPEACAVRECEEETGLKPGRVIPLLTYSHAEGYSTGFITLYLGLDLKKTGNIDLDPTEFVEQVSLPYRVLLENCRKGRVIDSKTILCTLYAQSFLKW